jgi:hypothetical protein
MKMFELTINGSVYQFRFGIGFVREINKRVVKAVEGTNAKQELGLQYAVASLIDEDAVALVDILDVANHSEKPRVTRAMLDNYMDDESTDVSALCKEVLDFLSKSNASKKTTEAVMQMVEAEMAKVNQQ